jgi:hypothetical protein
MAGNGGLYALSQAFGANPKDSDEDYVKRSLVPYAIAGAQLGQYRGASRTAVNQQSRRYRQDTQRYQRGYIKRRNAIQPRIGSQLRDAMASLGVGTSYGMGDLAAQGFSGDPQGSFAGAIGNVTAQQQGLADRQRSYMADTRTADAAQWRDTRNTGRVLTQSGRTAVQQAYMDAMARLFIEKVQAEMQLRQQFDLINGSR